MDFERVAPILEQIIKQTLLEKDYPYGFANYRGKGNKKASGTLVNSVQVQVQQRDNEFKLMVLIEDYARYVQAGRMSGKKGVPIKSLLEWIKYRNLKGRNKKGRFISNLSFAFAIQTNIKKFGIRPANFVDKSLQVIYDNMDLFGAIEGVTFEEIVNSIEGI